MELVGTETGFCSQTAGIWQQIGYLLLVFKIAVPALLIVIGIFTLGKAVISSDEKEIKKSYVLLLKKFILACCIFFVPTIVTYLFGLVTGFNELKDDYNVCNRCITQPKGEYCNNHLAILDE